MTEVNGGAMLVGAVWVAGLAAALIIIRVTRQRLREIEAERAGDPRRGRHAPPAQPAPAATPMPPLAAAWWTTLESVAAMTPQQWADVRAQMDAVVGRRGQVPGAVRSVLRTIDPS